MKLNFKVISLLFILCLLSISIVSATEDVKIDDLQAADEADDVITADNAKAFTDLKNEIINSESGAINLESDYAYSGSDSTEGVAIDKAITINGNGHVLDGKNSARILAVRHADVVINDVIFKNAKYQGSGAAIWTKSVSITLNNCTFINNNADYGGVLYSPVGGNKITNCKFINNTATSSGGAININGNDNIIENNYFYNNKATKVNGGAIGFGGSVNKNNQIIGNTFEKNSAAGDGGAIYLQKGSGDILKNNKFISNTANYGAAVSLYNTGYFTMTNNTFTKNQASGLGGAFRAGITDSKTKTTVSANTFNNNKASDKGGAIYISGSNVDILKNSFDGNTATKTVGGAINVVGDSITISNNDIKNSQSKNHGGAIEIEGKTIKITSNNIENAKTTAESGGAIYVVSASATISSNNFTKCIGKNDGGAISVNGNNAVISENSFTGCEASRNGGALYIYGASATVSNNAFNSNKATTNGGAIRAEGAKLTINANTFDSNTASRDLGIFGNGDSANIQKNTFAQSNALNIVWYGNGNTIKDNTGVANKVSKTPTKIVASNKAFKKSAKKKIVVKLTTSAGKAVSGQKVKLTVNKKTYTGKTNSKGKATIIVKLTKKGKYSTKIKFAATSAYEASSKTIKITVK